MDYATIRRGRKLVSTYRQKHTDAHKNLEGKALEEFHEKEQGVLNEGIKKLGFASLDDFFEQSKKANYKVMRTCYAIVGKCDYCKGRKRPVGCTIDSCPPDQIFTEEANWEFVWYHGGYRKGCSIHLDEIKKPPLDWLWR